MSKLSDNAKAYIEALGIEQSAKDFNVKESTVALWLKTGNYPQKVHEAVSEAMDNGFVAEPEEEPQLEVEAKYQPQHLITEAGPTESTEPTMADVISHLNNLYGIIGNLVAGQIPAARRVEPVRHPDGSLPSLVMQDDQFGSMVRVSQPIGPHAPHVPVVTNAKPSPVYAEPRNPDPNHWTKPKFVRDDTRRR